ncbi:MAG TPA: GntR family transcriptional regulator [Streptosporangiaceae bacterium]|jgi:GntR family transcriptional regulator
MPKAQRNEPLHLQIAGHYKRMILDGEIRSGQQLPSVREIRDEWEVGQQTAQRAVEHLKTEGLVRTGPDGTFANGHRAKYGPQQRIRAAAFPAAERVEMRVAELVSAPGYVVPILGLLEVKQGFYPVIRREWITYEDGDVPFMLTASWCPPEAATAVPELLDLMPLPDPGGAAKLIAERTGRPLTWGRTGRESRQVRDDGREGPLLRLPKDAHVLAEVYTWASGEDVLEYGEYVLLEGRVIESDMEP